MFEKQYIEDLIRGKLSADGYKSILKSIASMIYLYHWPKYIIVSDTPKSNWSGQDIKELTHMFFEWISTNNKLKYLNKVPSDYISYYFSQMLISFVSDAIKHYQERIGVSFQKCAELVSTICLESYVVHEINERKYVCDDKDKVEKVILDDENAIIKYMSHYPIPPSTKQYKPIIEMVVSDVLLFLDGSISIDKLIKIVFELLDQSLLYDEQNEEEDGAIELNDRHKKSIDIIINGISKIDAHIISEYLFSGKKTASLSELANKYNIPKSTIHSKIESFKRKIFSTYTPDSEDDGILFLKKLSSSLDEMI